MMETKEVSTIYIHSQGVITMISVGGCVVVLVVWLLNYFSMSTHGILRSVAGWEHIFEFADHIFGQVGSHSGIRMHMGHYSSHITSMIQFGNPDRQGFFSKKNARCFLQTGIALWLQSIPREATEKCCDHDVVGGDGTAIGIPVKQTQKLRQVWEPPNGTRPPVTTWGRLDRCFIRPARESKKSNKLVTEARAFVHKMTSIGANIPQQRDQLQYIRDSISSTLYAEIERWVCLSITSAEWEPLRLILNCIASVDSVTGVITNEMVPIIQSIGLAWCGTL
jgi:hypothetical protein